MNPKTKIIIVYVVMALALAFLILMLLHSSGKIDFISQFPFIAESQWHEEIVTDLLNTGTYTP